MTSDNIQCLLCRNVIGSFESPSFNSYKKHLTGDHKADEHKVSFYIKWIVNKTLEDQDKWADEDNATDDMLEENNEEDEAMDTEEAAIGETDKYSCNECGKEFPAHELAKHISACQGIKVFACKVNSCVETFDLDNTENIKRHIQRHQEEEGKKYECNECGKEYPGNELAQHISTCQGIKVFACKVSNCTETFDLDNKENIKSHIQRHQEEEGKKYACNECGKEFPGNDLAQHISICQGIKIFACKVEQCNDTFNIDNMEEIKTHIQRHQDEKIKYECAECGKEYPKNDLAQHISACQGIKIFACKVEGCPESFNIDNTEEVNSHIQRHQDEAAVIKDEPIRDIPAQNSNENTPLIERKKFMCDQCFNRYTTEDSLERHACKGLKIRPCKKKGCDETFTNSYDIKKHEMTHHAQFNCEICNKSLKSQKLYKKHKMEHSSLETIEFLCDICDQRFKTKNHVIVHKQTKHSVEPIDDSTNENDMIENGSEFLVDSSNQNDVIGNSNEFIGDSTSENILMEHENSSEFEPYTWGESLSEDVPKVEKMGFVCKNEGCNESFTNSNYLKNHEKQQHFQFSCDKCDKTSATKKFLKKHMMEHSGLGPVKYECDICDEKFKTERLVSIHKASKHFVGPHADDQLVGDGLTEKGEDDTEAPTI